MKTQARKSAISLRMTGLAEAVALAYLTGTATTSAAEPAAITQSAPASRQLAQAENTAQRFDIPPQRLDSALTAFAAAANLRLRYDAAAVRRLQSSELSGNYNPEEALRTLLAGTGVTYQFTGANAATLVQAIPDDGPTQLAPINVEGASGYAGQFEVDEGFKAEYQTTATKTPLTIRETPQSISVITQDSMEARQVQDLGQALETAAGVNQFSGTGPYAGGAPFGFDQIQIRGIFLDGGLDIREDGFVSPTFFSTPDVAIYERIEVVKGPSSVLYGRGSAGGFVNRVRKKPLPEFGADVKGSVGSYDYYRAEGDVTGPLFGSEKVRGRLIAAYADTGSFVDGVESERTLLAPSLEVDLTDSTRLLLQGTYQKDDFIPNPGFPLVLDGDRFRAPIVRRSLFFGLPNEEENEWEVLTGSAQLEQQLGDNWLATLRLNRSEQDSPIALDSYAYNYGGIVPGGDITLYSSAFQFDTDVWSGEFRLEGTTELLGRPANLTFGVDHFDLDQARTDASIALVNPLDPDDTANIYEENFAEFPPMDPGMISRSTVGNNKGTGVYTQLQFRPFERLSVLIGGRHDWADSSYLDRLTDTIDEKEDRDFTGRVGATFDAHDNVSVYGLYAQSFSPVLFSVGEDGILDPETGEIYEVGVKTEWLDGKLGINAAVFRIDRDKVPILDPENTAGEDFSISAGRQRSEGVELEINGEPLPGWNLSFGGILLDSEFIERADPTTFGNSDSGVADWQVGLFTSYELQDGLLRGLGLGAGLFAIDDRAVSATAPATLAGYERVDLNAFYNGFAPFKVRLQVRNVFDETYVEGSERAGAYNQFGSPTAVLMQVEYEFDDE